MSDGSALAEFSWQFVGGRYRENDGDTFMEGQAYVEKYLPREPRQPYPVVMWHGGVQTGTNFTATPDGRPGWVQAFLRAGYTVYVLEQPERGRSGHAFREGHPAPLLRYGVERVEQRFTGLKHWRLWPQAQRHTRWPGSGRRGDPVFDNFYASQVEMLADRDEIERLNRDAGIALLDMIGPAVVLTHSQSGPFGWLTADARPALVKAIVAVEPNGPPFREVEFCGEPQWFRYADSLERPYGITRIALEYDPPLASPENLEPKLDESLAAADLVAGYLQGAQPRSLPNLAGIPILIATAEASYHAVYDHCTSAFLHQAGVAHDFVRLADEGMTSNGHMVMLEENQAEIAQYLIAWLSGRIECGRQRTS